MVYVCRNCFMSILFYIGIENFISGIFHYSLSSLLSKFHDTFLFGTFAINIIGFLILSIIYALCDNGNLANQNLKLFLIDCKIFIIKQPENFQNYQRL
jgi:fluoride ion exporter CrcB/FEX